MPKKIKEEIFAKNPARMTEALQRSCVAIAGCGGLGSNAAVALVRAGVGKLIIADFDKVEDSNLNRQYFFKNDIGKSKVKALTKILKSINPEIDIVGHDCEITPSNIIDLFNSADLLIEAFDKAESKKWLIETWCKNFPKKPIVCGNGLSGFGKTEELKVTRISDAIIFCGDGSTDMSLGLCSARIAIVANMEANIAIELLVKK
jgi:sulfur carrier protein ThiS adenylyltransferase